MSGADVLFAVLALLAVASGWRVFRTDSMVRASFFLLASFLAVGCIVLQLGAPYLGAAVLMMMAVEMMVMAFFMVMFMMNPAGLNPMQMIHQPRLARAAGAVAALALGTLGLLAELPARPAPARRGAGAEGAPAGDPIAALGGELLGRSMLPFETAGVAILAAMVGSVVLSASRGRHGDAHAGSRPPPLVPDPQAPGPDAPGAGPGAAAGGARR